MLVFKDKKDYYDFVRVIGEGMKSDSLEFCGGMSNYKGFEYLAKMDDCKKKSKIMAVLRRIDVDLNDAPRQNDMFKKLSYFLKVGILFGENYNDIEKLSANALATLVTESSFSFENEKKYISLLSDETLLLKIRNIADLTDKYDMVFAIIQHYDANSFDIQDEEKLKAFRNSEIARFEKNREEYFSDVVRFDDLVNQVLYNKGEGVSK